MARSILWFRRDLRLLDHPALAAAAAAGEVLPLFVSDPALAAASGRPRLAYMSQVLEALDRDLGGRLVHRVGEPVDVVAALAAEVGAETVHVSRDYGPYGRARDAAVAARLVAGGRRLVGVGSPYAVDPGRVRKGDGGPYAVFTPFSRAWLSVGWSAPSDGPVLEDVGWIAAPSEPLPPAPAVECALPDATAGGVRARWRAFVAEGLDRYDTRRDDPSVDGTSRLSAALKWGVVHPRELLADLAPHPAHDVFRSELAWRDFYADVLFHRPETAWTNLQQKMDAMPVDTDAAARRRFEAWATGRTGYPIVDAGMRQLLATGWMHNRVRMVVASFLVKDLHLPWQWGARHFMRHLVDGDLASNNHGWQWVAGTGTGAAPYFRVFNPTGQSERFDPEGDYLRTWLPELASLDRGTIHQPGLLRPETYPPPMVDHAVEREEALARYRALRYRAVTSRRQ